MLYHPAWRKQQNDVGHVVEEYLRERLLRQRAKHAARYREAHHREHHNNHNGGKNVERRRRIKDMFLEFNSLLKSGRDFGQGTPCLYLTLTLGCLNPLLHVVGHGVLVAELVLLVDFKQVLEELARLLECS